MNSPSASLKKEKIFLRGFIIWTIWVLFYGFIMNIQITELNFFKALISSANMNYTFAFLSILMWQICKKMPFEKMHLILFFIIHFVLAILISVLWLSIVFGLWVLAEGKEILELMNVSTFIWWQFLFGMIQYFLIAGIFYTIIYYRSLKEKELAAAELKILTRDAELKALKMQINPHFLFNSLNSISALITDDPQLARTMISRLSELLRMSLESKDKLFIPLQEELDLVHKYLDIEHIRFGDKMNYSEEVDTNLLSKPFPAMLLQPLLENAVKHGIANSIAGGDIKLVLKQSGTNIHGVVFNQIRQLSASDSHNQFGNGTGLSNVQQRLKRLFGENYQWHIDSSEPNSFKVSFELPMQNA